MLSSSEKLHTNGSAVSGVTSLDLAEREAGAGAGKPVSTWSEHVWSTFIHRGYSDDVTERPDVVVGKGKDVRRCHKSSEVFNLSNHLRTVIFQNY